MIRSLRIQNLATIQDIQLDLNSGFSVLTGETGAGKSIVIESIKLVLGEKSSADIIRTGESKTSIEAVFSFQDQDQQHQQGEVFLQRIIPIQGSGKGYINGTLVPIKKLKDFSGQLVDIYGQNDHAFLRQVENQLDFLDHFARTWPLRRQVEQLARQLRSLIRESCQLETQSRERSQRLDFLSYQIKEIESAGLSPGEEEDIRQERILLKNAEKISQDIEAALSITYYQDDAILSQIARLQDIIKELSKFHSELKETNETLAHCSIILKDFSDNLMKLKESQDGSPEKLESLEERLSLIENLKRKYGANILEILQYVENARHEYKLLENSQEKLSEIQKEIEITLAEYLQKAGEISQLRRQSASKLDRRLEREISQLGMKKARLIISLQSQAPLLEPLSLEKVKDSGMEEVEFLFSPNPGEEPRPLRTIASGGELSRLMLGLKSLGSVEEKSKTLIFDEIDAGIGGRTAEFVAQKLSSLSQRHQVICITHLPQIASFARHHFHIIKEIKNQRTFTTVKKLKHTERIQEIARLLGGSHITAATLRNAEEMLERNLNLKRSNPQV